MTPVGTTNSTFTSTFLGREAELAEGQRLLRKTRLLTVTGPGGAGKTRFALGLARSAEPSYRDGSFVCLFASLRDPALVLPTIAHAFGIHEEGQRGALELIAERLFDSEALLVLDNLEHLLAATPELSRFADSCPGLTILCTSRERLRAEGELVYELPPLREDDAVALFCERAHTEPSPTIAEICARLEGLPLAIELAAARLKLLSPAQLLERLSGRLDLLKGSRDADPRQQTLRATIQWSYDLLSEGERRLVRRLGVFVGGCTLTAAEEVAGADPDTLMTLVEKSLLQRSETELGPRFSMLETIREFALEQLAGPGEVAEVEQRHAESMVALVVRPREVIEFGRTAAWCGALGPDADNLRAAFTFLERTQQPDLALQLVADSWPFWYLRGASLEGLRWAESALASSNGQRSTRRAEALLAASTFAGATGHLAEAERYGEESLETLRDLGETESPVVPAALRSLGLIATRHGDLERARFLFEEAVGTARRIGNAHHLAGATANLADVAMLAGDYEKALSCLDDALVLASDIASDHNRAAALSCRGACLFYLGRDAESLASVRECLATPGGDEGLNLYCCTVVLSALAARRGDGETSSALIRAADAIHLVTHWDDPVVGELYRDTVSRLRELPGAGGHNVPRTLDDLSRFVVERADELALAAADPR